MKTPLVLDPIRSRSFQTPLPGGRACLAGSLLALALVFQSLPCAAQSDDFNDGNDTDWFRYDPLASAGAPVGTWSFPGGNTYRIQSEPSPNPLMLGPGRAGSIRTDLDYDDFFVRVDIVDWDNTLDQAIGLMARLKEVGLGTMDGYAMTYDTGGGDIDIVRFIDEDPGPDGVLPVTGNDRVDMLPGRDYRLVFIGRGSELTARVFLMPDTDTPIAEIIAIDENFTAGELGLLAFDNSDAANGRTDVTFDNYFAAVAEPPRLSIDINLFGDLTVSWPSNASGFLLQGASSLNSPQVWTNLPGPHPVVNGEFQWRNTDTFSEPTKYFRLILP